MGPDRLLVVTRFVLDVEDERGSEVNLGYVLLSSSCCSQDCGVCVVRLEPVQHIPKTLAVGVVSAILCSPNDLCHR